ncbi:MAG: hypothetical protein HY291_19790, partial [Planctomycetes bacterium]|nr:hypothetical protein [Planctomycetota bacterium]
MQRLRTHHSSHSLACLLALLALVPLSLPNACFADGFEGLFYFSNDPYLDWQRLKPQMTDAATRAGVIDECLRILRFVDTYNNAADSPPWMHSEDGRANARECAVAILIEIGAPAAPKVWETLADDIRFQSPNVAKALQRARAAQSKAATALGDLRVEIMKVPALAKKLSEPAAADRDAELGYEWSILTLALSREAGEAAVQPIPVPNPRSPRAERKMHRAFAADFNAPELAASGSREWVIAMQVPEAVRNPAIAAALRRFSPLQADAYKEVAAYNALLQRANSQMASADMLPCDDFQSDLQRVLTGMGKDAVLPIEKSLHAPSREVAATAAKLLATIKDLREFKAPAVLPAHPEARRIAEVALEAWDLADETPQSKIAARAFEDLRARGLAAYPDLIAILQSPRLKLKKEALRALEMLSGDLLGEDPAAWQKWHAAAVEAEKHKPLPPDLAVEGLTIGESPNAPKRPPKPPAASENLPTPEKSDEEKTAGELLKDKFKAGEGDEKTGEANPGGKEKTKTTNVEEEDADKKR